jgi:CRISPR-associated protein Cmr3
MPEHLLKIRGIDPLLFRDGRPFSEEEGALSARTLSIPLPGTVAGFLRTMYGAHLGWEWTSETSQKAMQIPIMGPLLFCNDIPVFPVPADALVYEGDKQCPLLMPLRPSEAKDAGCDLPEGLAPMQVLRDVKPALGYNYGVWEWMQKWLANATGEGAQPPVKIEGPPTEERVHVGIDPEKGTSKEGMLFVAQFVSFESYRWEKQDKGQYRWSFLVRMGATSEDVIPTGIGTLGGERRLAVVEKVGSEIWPACPSDLQDQLGKSKRIRLILATPAIFADGWKPGWLDDTLIGAPSSLSGIRFKLLAAAVRRREAVSGWDYQNKKPKPVRWLVPAGSVYFFEVLEGDTTVLGESGWLSSVSDEEQARRDGYGLALWGVW